MRTSEYPYGGDPNYPMTRHEREKCDRHTEMFRRTFVLLEEGYLSKARTTGSLENQLTGNGLQCHQCSALVKLIGTAKGVVPRITFLTSADSDWIT